MGFGFFGIESGSRRVMIVRGGRRAAGMFQYCVTGTEFVTLGNRIRYTNWYVHTVP